jgi:AraC-like DNA-binding protein
MQARIRQLYGPFQRKQVKSAVYGQLKPYKISLISGLLESFMNEKKPFLFPGYSMQDLAIGIGIPAWQISTFLNRQKRMHFNEFVNHYRIWHCEELIQQGFVFDLDIEALARLCGFTGRGTFGNAFKKYTGFTPSRYRRGWERLFRSEINE